MEIEDLEKLFYDERTSRLLKKRLALASLLFDPHFLRAS